MKLGQTIMDIRKERNMTQEQFGQLFHVTRQTVSNWEKEKNYPDLETLIQMSDEFGISLDVMLKEDKTMVKRLNMDIRFSKNFKRNTFIILIVIVTTLIIGSICYGIAWNNAKNKWETTFNEGIKKNKFVFDEQLGYYTKTVDQNSYYVLPNQMMPQYHKFRLHFFATSLDYYTSVGDKELQIRWSEKDENDEIMYSIYYLDDNAQLDSILSKEQEGELFRNHPEIKAIVQEGKQIYTDVYAE